MRLLLKFARLFQKIISIFTLLQDSFMRHWGLGRSLLSDLDTKATRGTFCLSNLYIGCCKSSQLSQNSCTRSVSSPLRHLTRRQVIWIPDVMSRRPLQQEMNAHSMIISRGPMKRCPPIILLGGILEEVFVIRNSISIIPCINKKTTDLKSTVAGCFVKGTPITNSAPCFNSNQTIFGLAEMAAVSRTEFISPRRFALGLAPWLSRYVTSRSLLGPTAILPLLYR